MRTIVKREVRGILSLISIQSTPLTVVALLMGYATVHGTVISPDVIPLAATGALGHWTFYSMNDIVDYEYDRKQGRVGKPLVAGLVSINEAIFISVFLFATSLVIASAFFNSLAIILYVMSAFFGGVYNLKSKDTVWGPIFMAEWGVSIVFTGAAYSGAINTSSIILSLVLGAHMLIMTFEGDLKDVGDNERSIPRLLGCQIKDIDNTPYMFTSAIFNTIFALVVASEVILMMLLAGLPVLSDGVKFHEVLVVLGTGVIQYPLIRSHEAVMRQNPFDESEMKKDIALHEIVTVIGISVASLSYAGFLSILTLGVATILWGITTQTALYGHPLRFP